MQFRCPFLGVSPMCNVFLPEIIIPSARDLMKPSWLDLLYWVENCNRSLTKCHSSNSSQANFSGYLIVIHCMKKTAPTNVFLLYYYAINNFLSVIIATTLSLSSASSSSRYYFQFFMNYLLIELSPFLSLLL